MSAENAKLVLRQRCKRSWGSLNVSTSVLRVALIEEGWHVNTVFWSYYFKQ